MSNQESNLENHDEELDSSMSNFNLPCWFKWLISVVCVFLILFCIIYTCRYLQEPKVLVSPKELGISGIFLFSLSALFIVLTPWAKFGLRISKIGGVEFKEIVQEQASEHAEDIGYLEDRIEFLEAQFRKQDDRAFVAEAFQEPPLRKLLLEFLTKYNQWSFSPSRIRAWGSQQEGFSALSNFEYHFIRSTLQKMVSENILETRISKKGNTLYRVPCP